MKTIIFVIAVFASINLAIGELGDQCSSDNNCGGNKVVCINGQCKCSVGYREGSEKNCVHVIGTTCQADDDCENMPGSTCENYKCHCKAGYLAGSTECVGIGQEGDECTQGSDCIGRSNPPDNNKECKNKQCVCKASFHEGSDKRCKPSKNLRDVCVADDDCFQADKNNNNALECATENNNMSCKCKKGYKEDGDKCNGTAAKFILSASSLLLVAMAILKM